MTDTLIQRVPKPIIKGAIALNIKKTSKPNRFAVALLMLIVMAMAFAIPVFAYDNGGNGEEAENGYSIYNGVYGDYNGVHDGNGDYGTYNGAYDGNKGNNGYNNSNDYNNNDNSDYNGYPTDPLPPTIPMLTITNNPYTVIPANQTPSGYVEAGSELTIAPGYAEGWQFIGWSIEGFMAHSDFVSLFFIMPQTDVTVTAHWEAVEVSEPTPEPPPLPEPMGRVLITNRAQGTGQLLPGAVFEIRRHMDDSLVDTVTTNIFGEAALDLPVGDFFVRQIVASSGFVLNPERITLRITQDRVTPLNITNTPQPTPTPPPQAEQPVNGRLLVTSRAHGTGELVSGTVFELRRVMDDVFVARIVSNHFGEASVFLPAGDYFLREIAVNSAFELNPNRVTVRITADRLTEINVTHQPVTQGATTATDPADTYGRLLITNRAEVLGTGGREQGTGAVLANTLFEVRGVMDDRLIAQIRTNQFGEASVNLPAGDFFIRQIQPSAGFVLDSSRTNIRVVAGELLAITVISAPLDDVGEDEAPADGRLLVTLMSGATGDRLPNGTITIHNVMTDALITTITTDVFGEASVFLPAGRYFMRQSSMPQGYLMNFDRIPFTVNGGDITDMALAVRAAPTPSPTPTPPPAPAAPVAPSPPPATIETIPDDELVAQSRIEVVTRAAGSGNPLSGGIFAVYRAYDSRRMGELTTGTDGTAYLMVAPGMYFVRELRPTFGFLLESQRIFLDVGEAETVIMELTKERDMDIVYLPPDEGGVIYIPPTGQDRSLFHYIGGGIMLLISLAFGGLLLYLRFSACMRD